MQRAADSSIGQGFHIDDTFNGLAVATWRNQPNHHDYNNLIKEKLEDYINENPGATPEQCHEFLLTLTDQIKNWINLNPNSHLNNLILD